MLGLLLIYFVGKKFYDLADTYNRSKWGFAILGILSYYGGIFFGGVVIAILYEINMEGAIDNLSDTVLGLMGLPIGILACWGFYKILESNWKQNTGPRGYEQILDAKLPNSDVQQKL